MKLENMVRFLVHVQNYSRRQRNNEFYTEKQLT